LVIFYNITNRCHFVLLLLLLFRVEQTTGGVRRQYDIGGRVSPVEQKITLLTTFAAVHKIHFIIIIIIISRRRFV